MSMKNQSFYKVYIINVFLYKVEVKRNQLLSELIVGSADPVRLKRRCRMLRHLAAYESQIIKKLYDFDIDNVNDYLNGIKLKLAVSRNVRC
jgi:hypothetical protein